MTKFSKTKEFKMMKKLQYLIKKFYNENPR